MNSRAYGERLKNEFKNRSSGHLVQNGLSQAITVVLVQAAIEHYVHYP